MAATFTKRSYNLTADDKVAYINARVMDPATNLDVQGGLLTEGNKIADFGEGLFKDGTPEGATVIDCGGNILCPGLIDNQVHFREPGFEHKETLESGSKSSAAGGVTTVCCMPNTQPVMDDVSTLAYLHKQAEHAYTNVRTYAAISKEMKGEMLTEMAMLAEHGAIGFTDDGLPMMNAHIMRQALTISKDLNVPIAQHAEDLNLSNGGCMNEGWVSTKLGLPGIPNASESVIVARDILLTELTGGYYHVLHVSTKEAVELIRQAKEKGLNVTAEAAPHHFTLTDEAVIGYRTFSKMNPPLRGEEDRAAIIEALKDGTIDIIATDHAPHDTEAKRVPMEVAAFGIVGLETMLPLSLNLVHDHGMPLMDVLAAMTYKVADIIRQPIGRLEKGAVADLTIIDPDAQWEFKNDDLHSKSKNSPFDGMAMRGRAVRTIVGGETVYEFNAA